MKRFILIGTLALSVLTVKAQNQVDALRYSQQYPLGTARFTAMGGAFSSLGGDFSAISLNPAGLGVYRSSELTISTGINYTSTKSTFMNNLEKDSKYNVNWGNFGYAGTVLIDDEDKLLKSLSIGIGYNNLNNFNEVIEIEGRNTTNSLTQHLAAKAYGLNSDAFEKFFLFPAWETFLIDPDPNDPKGYISTYDALGQLQKMNIHKKGHIGEWVFALGMNFNHKFYVGGNFGIQGITYNQSIYYEEIDDMDNSANFKNFNYNEKLKADGTGYNFKIGAIYRPIEALRIGASVHTPTFYNINEEYSTNFFSNLDTATYSKQSPLGIYNYNLTSPFRAVGGVSFMFLNSGLVSVDYEFADYSMSKLRGNGYSFDAENDAIEEAYVPSHNIKLGLEYKIGAVALRGGYAYHTSPFAKGQLNENQHLMRYSGGLGFRAKSIFFDLAYLYSHFSENFLQYEGYGVNAPVTNIDKSRHSVLATIGFRF